MAATVIIKIDPPQADHDDFEEFLATDDLFVDYLNYFLALPSFPEPLYFNAESGGFEVVCQERQELGRKIKAAIRSQRPTPRMYRLAKKHAYINIPLIPLVDQEGPEKLEIDTSFKVRTLNKETGVHWVKAERLPSFLQSGAYLEYRLATVLSQVRLLDPQGHYTVFSLDFTPRPPKKRKKDEEPRLDLMEVYMKNLYVSLGMTSPASAENWFSLVQEAQSTDPPYATLGKTVSASRPVSASQLNALRKAPGSSTSQSKPRASSAHSSISRPDSGIGVRQPKRTVFSQPNLGAEPGDPKYSPHYENPASTRQPFTPRPGEPTCVTSGESQVAFSRIVYLFPKAQSADEESGVGDLDNEDLDGDSSSPSSSPSKQRQQKQPKASSSSGREEGTRPWEEEGKVVVETLDDLCGVVVGAAMKKVLSDMSLQDQASLERHPQIKNLYPDSKYSHISTDMLDNVTAIIKPPEPEKPRPPTELRRRQPPASGEESDADSLLDSEGDYEEEDRAFFRRHHPPPISRLDTRKSLQAFKRFLKGTSGIHLWHLWLDIDRLVLVLKPTEQPAFLSFMREKYHKRGAEHDLGSELIRSLRLTEISHWTVPNLHAVQGKVAEPIVTYWAPRFLLKELLKASPEKFHQYQQQKMLLQPLPRNADPAPPTLTLLPLRPRSCIPHSTPKKHHLTVEDMYNQQPPQPDSREKEVTTPDVGFKRRYGPPAVKVPPMHGVGKARQVQAVPPVTTKRPQDLVEAHLKVTGQGDKWERQNSGPKGKSRKSSSKTRPKSAKPGSRSPDGRAIPPHIKLDEKTLGEMLESASQASEESQFSPGFKPRPKTAPSGERAEEGSSTRKGSKFRGGERMEALLQALYYEKDSGYFFRNFLRKGINKLWLDCVLFWEEVQSFRMLFYQNKLNPYLVKTRAQIIFSRYIVLDGPRHIGCPCEVRTQVYQCLDPPQEELFDEAEKRALNILFDAWMEGLTTDLVAYGKVEQLKETRHLQFRNKYMLHLQKKGLIKERPLSPDIMAIEGMQDPVYNPDTWDQVPDEVRHFTLDQLVHNRLELEHFKQFLAEKYADIDLRCWMDIEAWRRIAPEDDEKREQKAKDIKKAYFNKKYFFGPNSPASKDNQDKIMLSVGGWKMNLEDRPPNLLLTEAQRHVRRRLEFKWLPLFLTSPVFLQRQRTPAAMDDVVDDVMVQRRRRNQAVLKMLESRWISSSKEIQTFRKALSNPITSHQFRRFVSIKGDNFENDVLFWQEVQKYKKMHHVHTEDALLGQKITAIVNCFLESPMPPSLQVDLPQEMVDRILDRKHEKGPYLFREAQLTVFRILFGQWNEFCQMRSNLAHDMVLPTIERLRQHAREKERRKQEEMDKKEEEKLRRSGSEEGLYDPFQDHDSQEAVNKDRLEFSYSTYIKQFSREEVLNRTDSSLFDSLRDLAVDQQAEDETHNNPHSHPHPPSAGLERRPSAGVTVASGHGTRKLSKFSDLNQSRGGQAKTKGVKKEEAHQERSNSAVKNNREQAPEEGKNKRVAASTPSSKSSRSQHTTPAPLRDKPPSGDRRTLRQNTPKL